MGSHDFQRRLVPSRAFADTEQTTASKDGRGPDSLPAPDSDLAIGLDLGGDADTHIAERPTLSHIGRYALKSLLGEGGLGRVYEAWDPLLSRTVALKTLQFDLDMPSRIALDRLLLNEARAAANLNHAHIVTVYDAGLSAHGVYIAMERLHGRDLRQLLGDGWRPTPAVAAQIVRRVADALAYAHARGVVHCDIKPGNIFLTRKDRPKVLDFGIARVAHATAAPGPEAVIAGSPHYLAPEQLTGGAVDARTDIYALGVVLYELLAGRKAFVGDSLDEIHAAVRQGRCAPLAELAPEVPAALAAVVARAMDPDPERRPASANELSQALRHAARPVAAEPGSEAEPGPARSRRVHRWALSASLGVALLALASWWAADGGEPDGTVSTPAAAPATGLPAAVPVPAATPDPASTSAQADKPDTTARTASPAPEAAERKAAATTRAPVRNTQRAATAEPAAEARSTPPAAPVMGTLQIAVSPWGEVEIDGRSAGTTPPLTRLELPAGTHTVTIRNTDFPPYSTTVTVDADRPVVVRHRFGS